VDVIEVASRIEKYRRASAKSKEDYSIGCILLETPFFFDRNDWIPLPDWQKPIVRGKGFATDEESGKSLWTRVESILQSRNLMAQRELEIRAAGVGEKRPNW
jgi:putative restriction endonuclease